MKHDWQSSKSQPGYYQCARCGIFGYEESRLHKRHCDRLEPEDDRVIAAFCGAYVYNPNAPCTCGVGDCSQPGASAIAQELKARKLA